MPTLSVFIRKDDVDKWKALPNKSEWLHNRLNQKVEVVTRFEQGKSPEYSTDGGDTFEPPKVIKTAEDAQKALESLKQSEGPAEPRYTPPEQPA